MTDSNVPWYRSFFGPDYLAVYAPEFDAAASEAQAVFCARMLGLEPGQSVLDLCCGQGRHAVPLARLGLRVTGLDLSAEYLRLAESAAAAADVGLRTVEADMRDIPYRDEFDAVVNLFSSFGYLESEDEDLRVLKSVHAALKPGGRLLLDLLNREWVILNYDETDWRRGADGTLYLEQRRFDPVTSRNHVTFELVRPDGARREVGGHHIRLYTLTEALAMLRSAGLEHEATYGGYEGEAYGLNTRRMILQARKPA